MYDIFDYNGTLTNYPSKTDWFWITHSDNDYSNFNFDYHVPHWEESFLQVFGDQHSRDSHTYLVNKRHTIDSPWQFHKNIITRTAAVPVFNATNLQPDEKEGVRMFSNFFNFIKRCCNNTEADYFWVTSSVCDYTNFDFTWHPDIGEEKFLHAWTTKDNKNAYTFFVPRQEYIKQIEKIQLLEWFEFIKYHEDIPIHTLPINFYDCAKGCADAVRKHNFTHHYEWFIEKGTYFDTNAHQPSRWDNIHIDSFETAMCVPREAKSYITDQIYDYPHITKHNIQSQPDYHDIIFISYDEIEADKNYEILKQRFPRTKRLHGVNGMVNALKQSAELSDTGYFYAVFAKTQVHPEFMFNFKHDRLIVPSNYIFHCYNPVIDVTHGAMGIVLYNTSLVQNAKSWGLDFTTSFPVQVVPQLSCVAAYNVSPFQTWRTAFRECVKLYSNCIPRSNPKDNKEMLDRWLSIGEGKFGEWSIQGAKDAVSYVDKQMDLQSIMDWQFLRRHFVNLHNDLD